MSADQPVRIDGGADATETAVVLALLTAMSNQDAGNAREHRGRSLWSAKARQPRPPLHPGPGAWRGSALPR